MDNDGKIFVAETKTIYMNTLQLTDPQERVMSCKLSGYIRSGYFEINEVETDAGYFFRLTHHGVKVYSMTISGVVQKSVTLADHEKKKIMTMLDLYPQIHDGHDGFNRSWDTYYNRTSLCRR